MTKACFFFFRASRKSSEPRWLTPDGLSSQDCSGGGGACGLQNQKRIILIYNCQTMTTHIPPPETVLSVHFRWINVTPARDEQPFINLQKSGSVGIVSDRNYWTALLTRAWTRWSCLYFGAVAACTSPRLSQSISDLGSRRSWSALPPPCARWHPLLPTRQDSGEISNNKPSIKPTN